MAARKLAAVDRVKYEPVMEALGKARAASMLLRILDCGNDYIQLFGSTVEERDDAREWLVIIAQEALDSELDTIEAEYRKLGTAGRLMGGSRSVDELAKAGM